MKKANTPNCDQVNSYQSSVNERKSASSHFSGQEQQNTVFVEQQKTQKATDSEENQTKALNSEQSPSKENNIPNYIDLGMIKKGVKHIKQMIEETKSEGFNLTKENTQKIVQQCATILNELDQIVKRKQSKNEQFELLTKNPEEKSKSLQSQLKSLKKQNFTLKNQVLKLQKSKQATEEQLKQIEFYFDQLTKTNQDDLQLINKERDQFKKEISQYQTKESKLQQMIEKLLAIRQSNISKKESKVSEYSFEKVGVPYDFNQDEIVSKISYEFYVLRKDRPNSLILPKGDQSSFDQSSILGKSINSIYQSQKDKNSAIHKYHSGIISKTPIIQQEAHYSGILSSQEGEIKDKTQNLNNQSQDQYATLLQDYPYLQKTN